MAPGATGSLRERLPQQDTPRRPKKDRKPGPQNGPSFRVTPAWMPLTGPDAPYWG
jgi:hypothetical protein